MDMGPILDALAAKTAAKVKREDGDYINSEGLLMCGKCNTPKQVRIIVSGVVREPYCLCDCEQARREKERKDAEKAQIMQDIPMMREACFRRIIAGEGGKEDLTASRCESWTFANDDMDDPAASSMARKYVEHFGQMRQDGKGLLLYGGPGGGKSYLAACICNALIDQAIPCYYTSVSEIVSRMRNKDRSEIDGLSRYQLVVLDDLGAERSTEYMIEMVHAVIDSRSRSGLPLIVTSNYTGDEIRAASDMQMKRVFSRLYEICIPYEIKHPDRRRKTLIREIGKYRELLGIEGE